MLLHPTTVVVIYLTTRSRGYPTPITYRGLSSGNNAVHCDTTLQNACFSSPPARPPTAYPGRWSFRSLRPEAKVHSKVTMCQSLLVSSSWSRAIAPSTQTLRSLWSSPPCIIPNNACSDGRRWAAMQRSIQRRVRWVAFSNLDFSLWTELTTSSRAMIISAPMSFWMWIDRSGVSIICWQWIGDWNLTPFSFLVGPRQCTQV